MQSVGDIINYVSDCKNKENFYNKRQTFSRLYVDRFIYDIHTLFKGGS